VIVSSDTHIGPRAGDLRPYCPREHLDDFDAYIESTRNRELGPFSFTFGEPAGRQRRSRLNRRTEGHHDMKARHADLDRDGIVAEVIFHGSQNEEHIPFAESGFVFDAAGGNLALKALGYHIYNQWLADACSLAPERSVGLAHIPVWDVEASVREVEWARAAGLRGVNWPAPRVGVREYDDPAWEPLWSACEDLHMPLDTHAGAPIPGMFGPDARIDVPHAHAILQLEGGGWPARRGMHRMIFAGIFERHPGLKLVLTEQPGIWWSQQMVEMDSVWLGDSEALYEQTPRLPSDYCRSNVFVGASFMASFELEEARDRGYVANMMWGSDYPHREGTWGYREHPDDPDRTWIALRNTFADFPADVVRSVLGENAIRVFELDGERLGRLAREIGAPSVDDIVAPLTPAERDIVAGYVDKDRDYTHAFREHGPWT
jgi:predicted TIM-barrel fold metal-dependent hydrolase